MLSFNSLQNGGLRTFTAAATTAVALGACSSQLARVPPRLDMGNFDRVALVTFSADPAKTGLGQMATQRFAEQLLSAQTGFELLGRTRAG